MRSFGINLEYQKSCTFAAKFDQSSANSVYFAGSSYAIPELGIRNGNETRCSPAQLFVVTREQTVATISRTCDTSSVIEREIFLNRH
jgi:hypothetical protein